MKKKFSCCFLLLAVASLSGCGEKQEKPVEQKGKDPEPEVKDLSGFSNITDETFDIHTPEQKAFLEYSGDYETCPGELYPDGTKNLSDSLPITLGFDYDNEDAVDKYSIMFGQKEDLSDGYIVNGTKDKSITFYNPYLGTNYYKLIANYTDGTTDETLIRSFTVSSSYPRNLTIEGMTNCRDLGGRQTADGGTIKQGLIYRTSGKNQNGSLTDKTTEEMVNHLKVKNEINLAGDSDSYNLKLTGTTLIEKCKMDTSSTGGYNHLSRNAEAAKNFFLALDDENNYPLFYHCKIGTDRTGVCSVLLAGLLGVPENEIFQDYLFSNFGKIGEKRGIGTGDSHDMKKYFDDILAMPGENFRNKVYNMLLGIGLKRTTLDHIIDFLTEGNKATGNNYGQIIARADALTPTGVTVSTDTSDRDNPDTYYVLNAAGQSLSYTFTAEKAFSGSVYAYLGNAEASTSKKIGNAITYSYDGTEMQVRDVTYKDARMDKCSKGGKNRTNYYPVLLGNVDVTTGQHTITINYKGDTMNVGGIYIF
ncbi:MAG: tyrosine-protein phosphatase [Bacilli bacterium]|nr:tyrosine-protein phosphatase [Bacilli bacterium]